MTRFKSAICASFSVVAFAVLSLPIGAQPTPQGRGPGMTGPGSSGQQMPSGMMGDSAGTSALMGGMMPMRPNSSRVRSLSSRPS